MYEMNEKFLYFDGLKFTRDKVTGYYLNSTLMIRMHRYVWQYFYGEIPKGYEIHHIDGDKSNNDIKNLEMLDGCEHRKLHGAKMVREHYDELVQRMNHAREYANKWHGSKAGKAWHMLHYEQMKENLHCKVEVLCTNCGKPFFSTRKRSNHFCSNSCKAAWRRKTGVDNEERKCEYCGQKFIVNKYSKTRFCSGSCANKFSPRLPQLRQDKKSQSSRG